jgi:hypothetical protein
VANQNWTEHKERAANAAPNNTTKEKRQDAKHSIKEGGPSYAKLPGPASAFVRDKAKFGVPSVKIYRTDQNIVDSGYQMHDEKAHGRVIAGATKNTETFEMPKSKPWKFKSYPDGE